MLTQDKVQYLKAKSIKELNEMTVDFTVQQFEDGWYKISYRESGDTILRTFDFEDVLDILEHDAFFVDNV